MARRQGVDREEVFAAADRLAEEGKPITANTLLEALGGGSFTTIYKHLNSWQAERPVLAKSNNNDIPAAVQTAFASTWKVAAQEAAREVEEAKAKAAEEVKAANDQFNGAVAVIEKLEKENETFEREVQTLQDEISRLREENHQVQAANAALKASDEEIRRQLDTQKMELDRSRNEVEKSRKERDDAIKQAAELKGSLNTLQAQNNEILKSLAGKNK